MAELRKGRRRQWRASRGSDGRGLDLLAVVGVDASNGRRDIDDPGVVDLDGALVLGLAVSALFSRTTLGSFFLLGSGGRHTLR